MPTPTNVPGTSTGGREIQNPELFAELTERQLMPQTEQEFKGLSKTQRLVIEKVGIVSKIRLLVEVKFTPKEETTQILKPGFPFKILKEAALQANGVTGVIAAGGITLQQRRLRIYRNPVSAIFKSPKVGEKLKKEVQTTLFVVEIPIAHDMLSLVGSLLAQNEETQLSVLLTWATEEEIVEAGTGIEKVEGTVKWINTVFSVGSTKIGKQEVTVLPDLSAFHGLLETETSFSATGERRAELIRTAGQLLCYTAAVQNGAGGKSMLKPTEMTTFKIEYGGNKTPLVYTPAEQLLEQNADDYDGALTVQGYEFIAADFEADNTARDMFIPESLTELRGVIGVPGTFVPSSAIIRTSQETLYPAV